MALPNSAVGTRFGSSAWPVGMLKARATPNRVMTAKIGQAEGRPARVRAARKRAQTVSRA